ncbi:hypothetical protein [Acetobacter estunensis]|uniref:hypothetical protein n=1 Tax=Acetobacter estunensis TaxID=104097 RepID=UPI001C2CFF8A|nr:hypothetical protein [Acetobacter estunensis]MBV1835651.1 hypothetical protein [Acetobacter estunensis]MBV1836088.1 hypothetical protein [Acetobacter estunensis]
MAANEKTDEKVAVITKRLIYPTAGAAPHPIGTRLEVSKALATWWEGRGIARVASENEAVAVVKAAGADGVKTAPPPKAPEMTPPPEQNGPNAGAGA